MKTPAYTRQFQRDLKLAQRRRKSIDKLKEAMTLLLEGFALPQRFKDHPLRGDYAGFRECHIESDWLLVYEHGDHQICFVRTGTHADLFR